MLIKDAMTEKKEPSNMQQTNGAGQGGEPAGNEQQEYERMVLAGVNVISDETMSQNILNMLQQMQQTPEEGLAEATAFIVGQIDSQGDFPETVILKASEEILENVAELANSAKVYQVDEELLQSAGDLLELKLADMYGVDPQDPEFQEMIQNTDEKEMQSMVGKYGRSAG